MKDLKIEEIKNEILGKRYELSFSFISKSQIKSLNKKYRKINKPTDVLSFSLEKNSGEILICKEIAKQKSKEFNMTPANYLIFLVIHACLHLKGFEHGDKMEQYEFSHYNRYRRRHL